jgi:hypothetical protein
MTATAVSSRPAPVDDHVDITWELLSCPALDQPPFFAVMGVLEYVKTLFTHPNEFRALIEYAVWRNPLRKLEDDPATSGWDREDMRRCWSFLDMTSRSFAFVIKELEGDLARAVGRLCLSLEIRPSLPPPPVHSRPLPFSSWMCVCFLGAHWDFWQRSVCSISY